MMGTLYIAVAFSTFDAMLTSEEKYEASILNLLPTAPSMAHPKCKPKLMSTRHEEPRTICSPGWPRYVASVGHWWMPAIILTSAQTESSATRFLHHSTCSA